MPDAPDAAPLPTMLSEMAAGHPERATGPEITELLESMVLHPQYPCLGARSAFRRDRAQIVTLDRLGSRESALALLPALTDFARGIDLDDGFASLVGVFRDNRRLGEQQFEHLLWQQLRRIQDADESAWDPAVSADPADPHYAFSAGGTAFFVVGLHPAASRIARRTPLPTLVFNLHAQFERLRAHDQYERMRDTIRQRDQALQGSRNPMVEDHGVTSEARQYAGRRVPDDWQPPVAPDGNGA